MAYILVSWQVPTQHVHFSMHIFVEVNHIVLSKCFQQTFLYETAYEKNQSLNFIVGNFKNILQLLCKFIYNFTDIYLGGFPKMQIFIFTSRKFSQTLKGYFRIPLSRRGKYIKISQTSIKYTKYIFFSFFGFQAQYNHTFTVGAVLCCRKILTTQYCVCLFFFPSFYILQHTIYEYNIPFTKEKFDIYCPKNYFHKRYF